MIHIRGAWMTNRRPMPGLRASCIALMVSSRLSGRRRKNRPRTCRQPDASRRADWRSPSRRQTSPAKAQNRCDGRPAQRWWPARSPRSRLPIARVRAESGCDLSASSSSGSSAPRRRPNRAKRAPASAIRRLEGCRYRSRRFRPIGTRIVPTRKQNQQGPCARSPAAIGGRPSRPGGPCAAPAG